MPGAFKEFMGQLRTEIKRAGVVRLVFAFSFIGVGGWLIQQGYTAGGSVALGFAFFLLSNAV